MTTDCQSCGSCDDCQSETRRWLSEIVAAAVATAPRSARWIASICRAALACDEHDVADMLIRYVPASDWTNDMRELAKAVGREVPEVVSRRPTMSFSEADEFPSGPGVWFEGALS